MIFSALRPIDQSERLDLASEQQVADHFCALTVNFGVDHVNEGAVFLRKFDTDVMGGGANPDRPIHKCVRPSPYAQVMAFGESVVLFLEVEIGSFALQKQRSDIGASLKPRTSAIARAVSRIDSVFFCCAVTHPAASKAARNLFLRTDEHQVRDVGGLGGFSAIV